MKADKFLALFKIEYEEYYDNKPCPHAWTSLLKDVLEDEITKLNVESIKTKFVVKMIFQKFTDATSLKLLNIFDIACKEAGLYLHDNDEKKKLKI